MKRCSLLAEYKIRDSRARREIAKLILSLKGRHFSAENILNSLKRRKSKVSRASTFRALNLFSQKGLLGAIDLGRGFKMYEVVSANKHHDHLYCMKCGKILEFEDKTIEALQEKVCRKNEFHCLEHTLRILGLCKKCKGYRRNK